MGKHIVQAVKGVGADLLEIAAPEIAEVVISREKFRTPEKNVGRQTLKKCMGSGSRKKTASRNIPTKHAKNKPVDREETFLQTVLINHVQHFSSQTFAAVSGNLGGEVAVVDYVLLIHEKEIYPTTSLNENCI